MENFVYLTPLQLEIYEKRELQATLPVKNGKKIILNQSWMIDMKNDEIHIEKEYEQHVLQMGCTELLPMDNPTSRRSESYFVLFFVYASFAFGIYFLLQRGV